MTVDLVNHATSLFEVGDELGHVRDVGLGTRDQSCKARGGNHKSSGRTR